MRLVALVEIQNEKDTYAQGSEFEAADGVARSLIRYGIAKEVTAPKPVPTKRNPKRNSGQPVR